MATVSPAAIKRDMKGKSKGSELGLAIARRLFVLGY
jgi:hypothetical protein